MKMLIVCITTIKTVIAHELTLRDFVTVFEEDTLSV